MPEIESKDGTENFLTLFLKHEMDFRCYIASICPSQEECDEILQRTSVIMWRKFQELRKIESFKSWGMGIARIEALAYRRERGRDKMVFCDELIDVLADEGTQAQIRERREDERKALRGCIQKLNERQQKLVSSYYEERAPADRVAAAEKLGISMNNLYKTMERIREKLHACITRQMAEMGYDQ